MTRGTTVLLLLALTGCQPAGRAVPRPCAGAVVTVDEVRGDVNATFLRAVVRDDSGAPAAGDEVRFQVLGDGDTFWSLGPTVTDSAGTAVFDLGAAVLVSDGTAAAAERGETVQARLSRVFPGANGRRPQRCTTLESAAFEPSVRTAAQPPSAAASAAELRRRLREVLAALGPVPRLPDGGSACRVLYAAAEDATRHPGWLGKGHRQAVAALSDSAKACPSAPEDAARRLRSVLA